MAPSPLRKRLTNEDKMKIIEESKQPGMKGKVPYILQNNGDLMINAEFLFNLIPHMMFRDKFVIVDYL